MLDKKIIKTFLIGAALTISPLAIAEGNNSGNGMGNGNGVVDSTIEVVSDSAITTEIMAKFTVDEDLSVFEIDVETNNGEVILTGTVDTEGQRDKAIEISESISGVKSVNSDNLKVKE